MVCQTIIEARDKPIDALTRDDISCRIIYVAQGSQIRAICCPYARFSVHPGGWVVKSALRQLYKREYPKFLRSFSAYVQKKTADRPLAL